MIDVFISYANEDRALASQVARELTDRGYIVWWDASLIGGSDFRNEIHNKIAESESVIVIWTPQSVNSRWVRDEADDAIRTNKLIPIRLSTVSDTMIPFGFRSLHTLQIEDTSSLIRTLQQRRSETGRPGPPNSSPTSLEGLDIVSLKERMDAGDDDAFVALAGRVQSFLSKGDLDGLFSFLGPFLKALPLEQAKELISLATPEQKAKLAPYLPKELKAEAAMSILAHVADLATATDDKELLQAGKPFPFWSDMTLAQFKEVAGRDRQQAINFALKQFRMLSDSRVRNGNIMEIDRDPAIFNMFAVLKTLPRESRVQFLRSAPAGVRDFCVEQMIGSAREVIAVFLRDRVDQKTDDAWSRAAREARSSLDDMVRLIDECCQSTAGGVTSECTRMLLFSMKYLAPSDVREIALRLSDPAGNEWCDFLVKAVEKATAPQSLR